MSDVVLQFIRAVVIGDLPEVSQQLKANAALATTPAAVGATRGNSKEFFFEEIGHYLYQGDTALHMAAAAFRRPVAELLIASGARHSAKNRRGAQPLHYAADTNHWSSEAQAETIAYLIHVGADPNAVDNSGVAPLHRAVRTRSASAVKALLEGGADPSLRNGTGSTAADLAKLTTGRSGSGLPHALEQQAVILELLRGATLAP